MMPAVCAQLQYVVLVIMGPAIHCNGSSNVFGPPAYVDAAWRVVVERVVQYRSAERTHQRTRMVPTVAETLQCKGVL